MDLDKLKKTWQSAEVKQSMNEDKIQHILNNRGQSAFNRILQYEKIGFITSFLLIIIGGGLIIISHTMLSVVNDAIPIFITISSIFLLIWNFYKQSFFKKIDIAKMSLIDVSKSINIYKRYLAVEGAIASIWTVTFAVIFVSNQMFYINTERQVVLGLFICIFSFAISYVVYKFTIKNDLETIAKAIKEAKDFEKENIE